MPSVSVPLAFLAGLFSFLSPCLLPLAPVYLGYLSGSTFSGEKPLNRWQVFSHALFFVGGFTLVFVILFGLPTTFLGNALHQYSDWVTRIGGGILILFGLHTIGIIHIPFLDITRRVEVNVGTKPGYLRSTLFGITFAAGWTPCVGPMLGAVMTLAFNEPSRGVALLLVYALGLAAPFLVMAVLLSQALNWIKRLNRYMKAIKIASGILMIAIGVLLIIGRWAWLNHYFINLAPAWLIERL